MMTPCNDPVDLTDPTGEFTFPVIDAAFIAYDIYALSTDSSHRGENWAVLGLDVAGAAIPGVSGLGKAYKAERVAQRAVEVSKAVTEAKRVEKAERASKIDRALADKDRKAFWKAEAKNNPERHSAEDLARMQKGLAKKGADGYSMERHHVERTNDGPINTMTRTDHRLGDNYLKNHPPQQRSTVAPKGFPLLNPE